MKTSDWKEYRPPVSGQPPRDYSPGDPVEFQYTSGSHNWTEAAPSWSEKLLYRYIPTSGTDPSSLSEDDAARNELPMFDGLLAYFPNALAYVSTISKIGNDQHNPGEPMHWARGKSTDHLNKIVRHTVDAGKKDARGVRHSGRLAWRALANLQEELEREEGAPLSRGSKADA